MSKRSNKARFLRDDQRFLAIQRVLADCDYDSLNNDNKNLQSCNHWHNPVSIGDKVLYASSYLGKPKIEPLWSEGEAPHLFVGLARTWIGELTPVLSAGYPTLTYTHKVQPHIIIDWEDKEGCPPKILKWLLRNLKSRIKDNKRIEISCVGGHGRTGSLIALLIGEIEQLTPKKAIQAVKDRYCIKAVESQAQINQIYLQLGSSVEQARKDWKLLKL